MKPALFDYHRPTTVHEAVTLLAELGDDAKLLAGGQSLIPLMNMRLARPEHLVDLGHVASLTSITMTPDSVRVGAMVRHREIQQSPEVAAALPVLSEAAGLIAHFQIRERGTVGGSVAHADPAAELPLVATLIGATIHAESATGRRRIGADEFFVSVFTTALHESEVVTEVEFPRLRKGQGWAIEEVARRHGDFAIVSAAAVVTLHDGAYDTVALALGGVGPVPVRIDLTGDLAGEPPTEELLDRASRAVLDHIEPRGDIHATAEDRRDLARTLASRAISTATRRTNTGA
jgi:aerobic carbon-monoxide dehydrogenase medium subunit